MNKGTSTYGECRASEELCGSGEDLGQRGLIMSWVMRMIMDEEMQRATRQVVNADLSSS